MARKSKRQREQRTQQDIAPPPARFMTSNKAMVFLSVVFVAIGVISLFNQDWIEAAMFLALGVVMLGASTPVFGKGRRQTQVGVALTAIAVALFIGLVIRDLVT